MFCIRLLDSLITEAPNPLTDTPLLPTEAPDLSPGEYGFAFIKLFLTFIVVAGLLGLTIWFLRRLIRNRFERSGGVYAIKVLEKKMISPKTMLYFVEVEGEKIILAESQLEVRQIALKPSKETHSR